MNSLKSLIVIVFYFSCLSTAYPQNYIAATSLNPDGNIKLFIRDFCYSQIQWQTKSKLAEEWSDISGGFTNPYYLDPTSVNLEENIFRAKVQLYPDTTEQLTYDFGIRVIEEVSELETSDLYDGSFVYYNSSDTILGTFYTRERIPFGCHSIYLTEELSKTGIGCGYENTQNILANCEDTLNAAIFCNDLVLNNHDDWFLPSIDELAFALQVLGDNKIQQVQNGRFGDFLHNPNVNFSPICVSSSELSDSHSYFSRLSNGEASKFNSLKNRVDDIFPSRFIPNVINPENGIEALMFPFQNLNVISILEKPKSRNTVLIEYNGEEFEDSFYEWNFGQGVVLTGEGKGPYEVQFDFGGYNRVELRINTVSCPNGRLYSQPYMLPLFTRIDSILPESYNGELVAGDLDNNGMADILFAGNDTTSIFEFNSTEDIISINPQLQILKDPVAALGDYNNDELLDIILSGYTTDSIPKTILFKNNGGYDFEEISAGLPNVAGGDVEWFDYDNDGREDLIITGEDIDGLPVTKIYGGTKDHTLIELETDIRQLKNSTIAIDDYNNDNFRDLLLMGTDGDQKYTEVYKNIGNGFEIMDLDLTGIDQGDCGWFDYNNDGLLDFVYTGVLEEPIAELNDQNHLSVSVQNSVFTRVYEQFEMDSFRIFENPSKYRNLDYTLSSIDLADYNNDGLEDILISGMPKMAWVAAGIGGGPLDPSDWPRRSKPAIFKNRTDGFTNIEVSFPATFAIGGNSNTELSSVDGFKHSPMGLFECSHISFYDFNHDGTLDILREGRRQGYTSAIYINDPIVNNLAPQIPIGLVSVVFDCNSVMFQWNNSEDDHTPSQSLTYDISIGTTPGACNIFSKKNNRIIRNSYFEVKDLDVGTYFWSVKAIDNGRASSDYANEESFTIDCSTNTEDNFSEQNFLIYPNPFSYAVTIEAKGIEGAFKYTVFNALGKYISSGNFKNKIIINDLPKSSQVLSIMIEYGDEVHYEKIIRF